MTRKFFVLIILIIQFFSCKNENILQVPEIIQEELETVQVIYPLSIGDTIDRAGFYEYDLTGDGENDINIVVDFFSGNGGSFNLISTALLDEWKIKTQNQIDSICYIISEGRYDGEFYTYSGEIFNCSAQQGDGLFKLDTNKLVKIFKMENLIDNTIYNEPDRFSYFPDSDIYESPYGDQYTYTRISARSNAFSRCDTIDFCDVTTKISSFKKLSKGIIVFENQQSEKYGLKVELINGRSVDKDLVIHEVQKIKW